MLKRVKLNKMEMFVASLGERASHDSIWKFKAKSISFFSRFFLIADSSPLFETIIEMFFLFVLSRREVLLLSYAEQRERGIRRANWNLFHQISIYASQWYYIDHLTRVLLKRFQWYCHWILMNSRAYFESEGSSDFLNKKIFIFV